MASQSTRHYWLLLALVVVCLSQGLPVASGAVVSPISVAQLPNDPVGQCGVSAVKVALATCKVAGPTPTCCNGLDAVFANSSSPAAWCLCIPQVLYKSVAVASDAGLDVLGVLHKCRKNNPDFQTQWAAAEPTACPKITFGINAAELVLQLGPDIVLASSKGRPPWAWSNMLQFGEIMQEIPDMNTVWDHVLSGRFASFMFLVIILMPPLFFAAHHGVLMRCSAAYKQLGPADQIIVCQHAVYIFVFGVCIIPQTVLAFTSLFKAWTGWYLDSAQIAALLGIFIASRAVLYAVEASVRSVIKWSWLLVMHHQIFFLIVLLALWGKNAAVAGLGVVLDLFACHEAPLYVALVSYRLCWPAHVTQRILRGAMVWYVLTRVFQTSLLGYMIVGFGSLPAVRRTPEFIVVAILCAVLTLIQAYTIIIYKAMHTKVAKTVAAEATGKGSKGSSGSLRLQLPVVVASISSSTPANSPSSTHGGSSSLASSNYDGSCSSPRHAGGSRSPPDSPIKQPSWMPAGGAGESTHTPITISPRGVQRSPRGPLPPSPPRTGRSQASSSSEVYHTPKGPVTYTPNSHAVRVSDMDGLE